MRRRVVAAPLSFASRRLSLAALDLLYVSPVPRSVIVSRSDRPVLRATVLGALALAIGLTLSACGRRGPMDPPPGASSVVEQPADIQLDPQGRPLAPAGQKRRLPIDWLLD